MGCSKSKQAVATTDSFITKPKRSNYKKKTATDTADSNDCIKTIKNDVPDPVIDNPGKTTTNKNESWNSPRLVIDYSNVVKKNENDVPEEHHSGTDVNERIQVGVGIENANNQAHADHRPGIVGKENIETGNEIADSKQALEDPGIVEKEDIQTGNEVANANQALQDPRIVEKEDIPTGKEIVYENQALQDPGIVEKEDIQTGNEIVYENQALQDPGIVEKEDIQTGNEVANANQALQDPGIVEKEDVPTGNEIVYENQALQDPGIVEKEDIQTGKEQVNANQALQDPGIVEKEEIQTETEIVNVNQFLQDPGIVEKENEVVNANQAPEVYHPGTIEKEIIQTGNEIGKANMVPEVNNIEMNVKESPKAYEQDNDKEIDNNLEVEKKVENVAAVDAPGKEDDAQVNEEEVGETVDSEIVNAIQTPEVHNLEMNVKGSPKPDKQDNDQEIDNNLEVEKKVENVVAIDAPEEENDAPDEENDAQVNEEEVAPIFLDGETIDIETVNVNQTPEVHKMNEKGSPETGKQDNEKEMGNIVVIEDEKNTTRKEDDAQVNEEEVVPILLDGQTIESVISEGTSEISDYETPHANAEEETSGKYNADEDVEENRISSEESKTEPKENAVDQNNEGNVEDEQEAVSPVGTQDSDITKKEETTNVAVN